MDSTYSILEKSSLKVQVDNVNDGTFCSVRRMILDYIMTAEWAICYRLHLLSKVKDARNCWELQKAFYYMMNLSE